eukprot:TRINITY_DN3055_c0_g1_i1.p1 TRINITY_DN3055_c0_g1~~TRINITY_DN3055_c0_g1_i1.p1  ORF type:complete len:224 (+),score=47.47 TRINITY_DN3055_c0_g1_i1:166-837(+)
MAKRSVQFYYDLLSPYSFFAFEVLKRYEQRWSLDIDMVPVLLGGIFQSTGNKSPITVPTKAVYVPIDLGRLSRCSDVPLKLPSTFPNNSLTVMRMMVALTQKYPHQTQVDTSREIWKMHWQEDIPLSDFEAVKANLKNRKIHGISESGIWDNLFEQTKDEAIKKKLKENTDKAVEIGGFGAPLIYFPKEKELFWGCDRFEVIASELGLKYEGMNPDKKPIAKL